MAQARAIIHLDMDAFYASVEQRDNPDLAGKPVIVGGHRTRGVVLAASYEVRPFGVRSAMSMVEATRRAPQAIVVPPRSEAYAQASEEVFAILETVTPLIEPLSLDEAFLDVTDSRPLFGSAADIARELRRRIREKPRLAASAGIAAVKFVAKIASDLAKPDGQREMPAGDTRAFLAPLPIGRLWGIGRKTEAALAPLGLRLIGDLAARDPDWLERRVPGGRHLWELTQGIDEREVIPDRAAKSIGAEDTFDEDLGAARAGAAHPRPGAAGGPAAAQGGVKGRVVQLKLKLSDFTLLTRQITLAEPTDDGQALYRAAAELLAREQLPRRVRLTGVSAQDLSPEAAPRSWRCSGPAPTRADRLNAALDRIATQVRQQRRGPRRRGRQASGREGEGATTAGTRIERGGQDAVRFRPNELVLPPCPRDPSPHRPPARHRQRRRRPVRPGPRHPPARRGRHRPGAHRPGAQVATHAIAKDQAILRYGQIIGFATTDIARASTCTTTTWGCASSPGSTSSARSRGPPTTSRRPRPSRASCAPTAAWPPAITSASSPRSTARRPWPATSPTSSAATRYARGTTRWPTTPTSTASWR